MSFSEEFAGLDPILVERAFANVSEDLFAIAMGGPAYSARVVELYGRIREYSEGFMALIGRQEEAIQMMTQAPGIEHETWLRMVHMSLGVKAAGLVLSEYSRLEAED